MMSWNLYIVLCVYLLLGNISISAAADLNDLKAGVVKITSNPQEGSRKVGTGFIIRVEPEVAYIITAAHVVSGDAQPRVEFFTNRNVSVKGAVLPGAEVNDDVRGLALVVVQGKDQIPKGLRSLSFGTSTDMVSGGEETRIIGHPGGGGDWAVLKRDISNRFGRDITLDPGVASRFSGGPMVINGKVMGIVMSNRGEFGLGITHKSVLNYVEGFGVQPQGSKIVHAVPSVSSSTASDQPPRSAEKQVVSEFPTTKTGKDNAPMVLVPGGEFSMGSKKDEGDDDEHPRHGVYLDAYFIDQYEVTVGQYKKFLTATSRRKPRYWDQVSLSDHAKKPVVGVSWHDAAAYCQWTGRRLPTEAEWEKAARGTEKRTYPWGDSDPTSNRGNFGQDWDDSVIYAEKLQPTGSYEQGKSPYGMYDMAGNVWEWVADWYAKDYYKKSPKKNPTGPSSGTSKVLRGGSWDDNPATLRSAGRIRISPSFRNAVFGFRCAQDAEQR